MRTSIGKQSRSRCATLGDDLKAPCHGIVESNETAAMGGQFTNWRSRRVAWAATLFLASTALSSIATAQDVDRVTMDDLVRAWTARHQQVRSGRFAWTETKWVRKGSLSAYGVGLGGGEQQVVPAADTSFDYHNELVFDGERMRYERDGPTWHSDGNEFRDSRHLGVWDGGMGNVLRRERRFAHGEIYDFAWDLTQPPLFAFRLAFRMLHPQWYSLKPEEYTIVDRRDVIDGRPCIIMETSPRILREKSDRGNRPWKSTYWISPEQDFCVVRYTRGMHTLARPAEEMNVSYKEDPHHGWRPAAWKRIDGSGDTPVEIVDARVTDYALNIPVDAEHFVFEFPEDAWVRDMRSNESYIARAGGERRLVTEAELLRGAKYEDLLETQSGQGATARLEAEGRRGKWVMWIAGAVLALAIGGYCAWKRLA